MCRNQFIDKRRTASQSTAAPTPNLLAVVLATLRPGSGLTAASIHLSCVLLGARAAPCLAILSPDDPILIGNSYLTVKGIMDAVVLAPELDYVALIGAPFAVEQTFTGLRLGFGSVAQLVGGIGLANTKGWLAALGVTSNAGGRPGCDDRHRCDCGNLPRNSVFAHRPGVGFEQRGRGAERGAGRAGTGAMIQL